ncbi:hypothetical protein HYV81_01120 [Candidatus Woesearchaeota archaeon]|nr:hypothetical protein [Candidatus Woesearchaeota archaeon]
MSIQTVKEFVKQAHLAGINEHLRYSGIRRSDVNSEGIKRVLDEAALCVADVVTLPSSYFAGAFDYCTGRIYQRLK